VGVARKWKSADDQANLAMEGQEVADLNSKTRYQNNNKSRAGVSPLLYDFTQWEICISDLTGLGIQSCKSDSPQNPVCARASPVKSLGNEIQPSARIRRLGLLWV
jgi:hypothetical protein